MALEDFFTLIELRDGLTSPARVNELITEMHKEKNCVVLNVVEATRQWCAVATTLAATGNKDCLGLFIQLDGLGFIDMWLNDCQKFGDAAGHNFVEKSVVAFLRALERLPIDNHLWVSSGIGKTVQNLLGHPSSVVQEKAKALCDWWLMPGNDVAPSDVKNLEVLGDDGTQSPRVISPLPGNDGGEKSSEQLKGDPMVLDQEETATAVKITDTATGKRGTLKRVESSRALTESDLKENATNNNVATPDHGKSIMALKTPYQVAGSSAGASQDSSSNTCNSRMYLKAENDRVAADVAVKHVGVQSEGDSGTSSHIFKPSLNALGGGVMSQGRKVEIDYAIVDSLDVTRRGGMGEIPSGAVARPNSPDPSNGNESQPTSGSVKTVYSGGGLVLDTDGTLVSEVVQASEINNERGIPDLNEEVSSEEICPMNPVSSPVAVRISLAPLQFERALEQRQSGEISAFRQIPESYENSSRERREVLNVDLNVVDNSEGKIEDGTLSQNIDPTPSGFPSGEGSSMRRLLDLNSHGDGNTGSSVLNWRRDGLVPWLQSRSLSVSSSMPVVVNNIDLNLSDDQPAFPRDPSLDHCNLGNSFNNSGGVYDLEESVISLFGNLVRVKREGALFPPPGRILDPVTSARIGAGLQLGSLMPYGNLSAYGPSGYASGLNLSYSPIYGPPGGPMSSSLVLPPLLYQQPLPYMMDMPAPGTPFGPNAVPHPLPNLDPNSGLMINRENREGWGQAVVNNQDRSVDEAALQVNSSAEASSCGRSCGRSYSRRGKRPGPDTGFEPSASSYNNQQQPPPPWI